MNIRHAAAMRKTRPIQMRNKYLLAQIDAHTLPQCTRAGYRTIPQKAGLNTV